MLATLRSTRLSRARSSYVFLRDAVSRKTLTITLVLLAIAASSETRLDAQQSPENVPGSNTSSSGTTSSDNAAIVAELEQMRARIAELENALREHSAPNQASATTAMPANTAMAPASLAPNAALETQLAPPATTTPAKIDPFSDADWTWLNGNPRNKDAAFDSAFFTPEIRADINYVYDFNHPKDDTISGSSELFRTNEVQVEQLGVGGDFHHQNVRARLMTQFGMYSSTTPRNDASTARGQWNLANAYRYLSEAYGGYHINALHGINVDAGIFMSYVGLFSYYNFDNWAYQPSYVSSNTPWFFQGVRVQIFPTAHLKIEPWFVNGWQSYGRFNSRPGVGGQIKWTPNSKINIISNNYGLGADALGIPTRTRLHTDNSIEVKYYDRPNRFLDKMAFSLTGDLGCETGGGVSCTGDRKDSSGNIVAHKQSFLGYMAYNRFWFKKDLYGFTLGGGQVNNPGRYLVLLPPINGADAASGTPYFTENSGDPFKAWDATATFDYMPRQYITFRWEYGYRHANVPYFAGRGGSTPLGGNTGTPSVPVPNFSPDLRRDEAKLVFAIMTKF